MGGRLSLYRLVVVGLPCTSRSPCAACHFPISFFSFFLKSFTCLPVNLALLPSSRISLSLFWGSHCISNHVLNRIVFVLPTYRLLSWCLVLSLLIFISPASPPPRASFWAFICSRPGGEVLCLILFLPCVVSCRLVRFELIKSLLSFSVSSFVVVYILSFLSLFLFVSSFSLVSYSSTSKRRASLSHTCTTTKF